MKLSEYDNVFQIYRDLHEDMKFTSERIKLDYRRGYIDTVQLLTNSLTNITKTLLCHLLLTGMVIVSPVYIIYEFLTKNKN